MKRRLGIGAALVAFSVAPSADAAVESAGGFSFVTRQGEVKSGSAPNPSNETIKVPCPGNSRVVSGGLGSDAGFRQFTFNGVPYDDDDGDKKPDDGWRLTGTNYVSGKVKFEGEAVCTKKLDPSYPDATKRVDAQTQSYVGVTCPGGRVAVGGGMAGEVSMNSSYPTGSDWGMYADNYSNKERKVKSLAVCVEPNLRIEFDSSSGTISPEVPGGGFLSCAGGEIGMSGGHSNSGAYGTIGIRGLNPSPGGFGYAIDNYSSASVSITTHTICFDPSV